jgi:restriction system protein
MGLNDLRGGPYTHAPKRRCRQNMKLQLAQNSLFAILLRSPWWISIVIAAGVAAAARLVVPDVYALFTALPFIVIGGIAGWRQLRTPSTTRVARTIEALRSMSWDDFSRAIEDGFRRDGYTVNRLVAGVVDFEMTKAGRTALVGCKRWKVARTGIEPLRELHAAKDARDAHECIYVTTGDISDNARAFAREKKIRLVHGVELTKLLPHVGRK